MFFFSLRPSAMVMMIVLARDFSGPLETLARADDRPDPSLSSAGPSPIDLRPPKPARRPPTSDSKNRAKLHSIDRRHGSDHRKQKHNNCLSSKPKPEREQKKHSARLGSSPDSAPSKSPALISSLLNLSSACGKANPRPSTTVDSGPNGCQSFLNCGITKDGGWNPPEMKIEMIKTVSLDAEPAKTTFKPCARYRSLFESHARDYDIPPIFLAAFAMQESSCRPNVIGDNGGAFGLMQITQDKCAGAPGGNCADPDYNIKIGAKTFADGLKQANGNVLKALGAYNGWTPGLTKSKALEPKSKGCCVCQQNLDYLQQFLNGWVLGLDPHVHRLGTMRNLDVCGDQS